MRRWWAGAVGLVVLLAAVLWWWRGESAPIEATTPEGATSFNEGALPPALKLSAWNAPIQQRGDRQLTGIVSREGEPVAGVVVTAVAAHGAEVLSDLPCKCDNHCGQMLLACGCAEASGQLVELVAARTGEGAPLARATTDARGAFTLTGLEPGTVTLFGDGHDGVGWLGNVATQGLRDSGWRRAADQRRRPARASRALDGDDLPHRDAPSRGPAHRGESRGQPGVHRDSAMAAA